MLLRRRRLALFARQESRACDCLGDKHHAGDCPERKVAAAGNGKAAEAAANAASRENAQADESGAETRVRGIDIHGERDERGLYQYVAQAEARSGAKHGAHGKACDDDAKETYASNDVANDATYGLQQPAGREACGEDDRRGCRGDGERLGDRRECGRDGPVACAGDEPAKPERNDYLFCVGAMGPAFEPVRVDMAFCSP